MTKSSELALKVKKILKLTGKAIGVLLLLVGLYAIIIVNFSTKDGGRYKCSGTLTINSNSQDAQLFFRVTLYRKWLTPWADSEGSIDLEIPGLWVEHLKITSMHDDRFFIEITAYNKYFGMVSFLSDTISIATPYGVYDGYIKRVE